MTEVTGATISRRPKVKIRVRVRAEQLKTDGRTVCRDSTGICMYSIRTFGSGFEAELWRPFAAAEDVIGAQSCPVRRVGPQTHQRVVQMMQSS